MKALLSRAFELRNLFNERNTELSKNDSNKMGGYTKS